MKVQKLSGAKDTYMKDVHSAETNSTLKKMRVCVNSQEDKRIAIGALITSFRVRKDLIFGRRPYSCYDFGNYLNVPQQWHDNRNRVFEFGMLELLLQHLKEKIH
jgi:hypothetical protein